MELVMKRYDAVVAGGGFAGASAAWWLRRRGLEVLLLEKEKLPGSHASGRNAGIARQAIHEAPLSLLAARSVAFIRNPPEGFTENPLIDESGGFLVSVREKEDELVLLLENASAAGLSCRRSNRDELLEAAPMVASSETGDVLFCPDDGLVDIAALLSSYLGGTEVITDAPVTGFDVSGGLVRAVKTPKGSFRTDVFIDGAGAWASMLGEAAGASSLAIEPRRRHLLHTGRMGEEYRPRSYVWFTNPPVYFRPESGGLLLSSCDETSFSACSPPVDENAPLWLYKRLSETAPGLADLPIARFWCELRCFTPDSLFLVGADGNIPNFYWVCGLAGHGMTTSAAVGELVADLITGRTPAIDPAPFSPLRFS